MELQERDFRGRESRNDGSGPGVAQLVSHLNGVKNLHSRGHDALCAALLALLASVAGAQEREVFGPTPLPAFEIAGYSIPAGERRQIQLRVSESFAGTSVDLDVVVLSGTAPGPTLCLIAGIHGDELNGTEIVRSALDQIDPTALKGVLIGVPIVNLHGFRSRSRYLPDRRDLNRHFPGTSRGSSASRIAARLFDDVVRRCDYAVDFHTGSFHRSNLTQVRGDLEQPRVIELALSLGVGVVMHNPARLGTLRRAATDAGVPIVLYESGEPLRLAPALILHGVEHVQRLLSSLEMVDQLPDAPEPAIYRSSSWVRVDHGGIFVPRVHLGESVEQDQVLATIFDPIGGERALVQAPRSARIIGMAVPQVVIPGFAAFHLGWPGRGVSAPIEDGAPPIDMDDTE
jgi:predicted deacylase